MTRIILLASLLAGFATGCAFDPHRHKRPARFLVGANARHFSAPMSSQVAFRNATPPPKVMTQSHEAIAATAQFTMGMRHHTYLGGELETGALDSSGSSTAGAYGVLGMELPFAAGALGAELASGWRSVRYSTNTEDFTSVVIEPRVRASVWLSEQTTLSVTGGMTLDDKPVYMAGVMFGIYSSSLGAWSR